MRGNERLPVERALDAQEDVFYVYDERGRLVDWNSALEDVFGLDGAELAGMSATAFFVPEDRPKIERAIAEVLESGSVVVEARASTADGPVLFELTGQRLSDEEGKIVGLAGIGRDVTTVREREWQLARQNERLSEFADVLAHDLRNPLQVALSYLEIEREREDSAELAEAQGALGRIERIIDDVLTVAREGQAVTEAETVDLATVARRAWEQVETGSADLSLRTARRVEGDPDRLERLFENCYRNALEHAGPGVSVVVADTDDGFVIEDDGPGFPVEGRERLFEPGVSEAPGGTGFGLNIVRNMAEAHGWSVRADDGDGGGARLAFELDAVATDAVGLDTGRAGGDGAE
jgi:PAS domain S-box-containing protein